MDNQLCVASELGFLSNSQQSVSVLNTASQAILASWLPMPQSTAHKYSRGKAVLIGGSSSYPGAACLASLASQYVGAGYTEVFTADSNISLLQTFRPSLVVRSFSALDEKQVLGSHYPGACIFGPGADVSDEQLKSLLSGVCKSIQKPLLIDGGALGYATTKEMRTLIQERGEKGLVTVLTPHGGEAARLAACAGVAETDSQEDYAVALSKAYNAIVVLKGPKTYIAFGEVVYVFCEGTPALAKAGTGDVLAGIIGSLLAQNMDAMKAAILGVHLHALAAHRAVENYSLISVCAEEVLQSLPGVLSCLKTER